MWICCFTPMIVILSIVLFFPLMIVIHIGLWTKDKNDLQSKLWHNWATWSIPFESTLTWENEFDKFDREEITQSCHWLKEVFNSFIDLACPVCGAQFKTSTVEPSPGSPEHCAVKTQHATLRCWVYDLTLPKHFRHHLSCFPLALPQNKFPVSQTSFCRPDPRSPPRPKPPETGSKQWSKPAHETRDTPSIGFSYVYATFSLRHSRGNIGTSTPKGKT